MTQDFSGDLKETCITLMSRKNKIAEIAIYISLCCIDGLREFGRFGLLETAKWGLESSVPVYDEEVHQFIYLVYVTLLLVRSQSKRIFVSGPW